MQRKSNKNFIMKVKNDLIKIVRKANIAKKKK